jgi:hypothetical protein
MKTARFILSAIVLAAASASASAANELVTNGGFEDYTGGAVSGYAEVTPFTINQLTGWTVLGSIDVINGGFGAISNNSIDMLGSPGPGSLSQTLNTVLGQNYRLSFDLAANGNGSGEDRSLYLSFDGNVAGTYVGNASVTHFTYDFTGGAAPTLLTFASSTGGSGGAVLDNVSVAAVPEPESYAMLLAGLGLMGFVAKRRKAKQA